MRACVQAARGHTLSWGALSHQGSQQAVGTLPPLVQFGGLRQDHCHTHQAEPRGCWEGSRDEGGRVAGAEGALTPWPP